MGEAKRRHELNGGSAPEPIPQRKIMICIPSYTGNLNVNTVNSIANASIEVAPLGWQTVLVTRSGDSILPRCRDVLVSQFYWSDCSDMLFWDADISCEPGAFTRLMSHPVEMVGGVYRGRGDPPQWPLCSLYPGPDGGINVQHPAGIGEVRGLGTGFLRITRAAIDRLIKYLPENNWYEDPLTAKGMKILHFFNFLFDFDQDPTMRLRSEDYAFCDLFRAAGGKLYADVKLTLHHSGSHVWTGNFQEHLDSHVAAGSMRVEGGPPGQEQSPPRQVTLVDAVEGMIAE